MLIWSISKASAAPTAQQSARDLICCARRSRSSGDRILLSHRPRMGREGSRMTAAANTGPKRLPRPTSSTPAMRAKPRSRAARSKELRQRTEVRPAPPPREPGRADAAIRLPPRAMELPANRSLFALAQTGCFAFEIAQIVELGPAHPSRAHQVNVIDHGRMQRENTLYTVAEADLANGYGLA